MNDRFKKLIATTVVAIFTAGIIAPAFATDDSTLKDLQQQQEQLNDKIDATKDELKNVTLEKNKTLSELSKINKNIDKVQGEIDALTTDIALTQENIAFTEIELENKQQDYDGRRDILANRLRNMYMYGDVNYVDVLFQAESFSDFITRFEYMTYIADNDNKLLEEVAVLQANLAAQKITLEAEKEGLEKKKSAQVEKADELELAGAQKEKVLKDVKSQESALYDILDAMEEESERIAANIASLQSDGGVAPTGKLVWPAPASKRITSKYGPRVHPIKKTNSIHTGVDIGAGNKTNILAAASGKVIVSTYNSSYGNYVVIDHGGGMSTLYAHMSQRKVKVGDNVAAGSVIGLVGSTGLSTGPHLHFEVRLNGKHTNPNPYLGI